MTVPAGVNGSTGWHVTNTLEQTTAAPGGGIVSGYKVGFQTGAGNIGSVFLPKTGFTPTAVSAAINLEAAKLDSVAALSAGPS